MQISLSAAEVVYTVIRCDSPRQKMSVHLNRSLRWAHKEDLGGHLDDRVFYRTGHFESLFGSAIQRCMVRDCRSSSSSSVSGDSWQ